MPDFIVPADALQTGRIGNTEQAFINYTADFTGATALVFDFSLNNQLQTFGVPKTLFLDNGTNPSEVTVEVSYTGQVFTCPAFSQGSYTLNAQQSSQIRVSTAGGSSRLNAIAIYNVQQPPVVWYDFGPFDSRVPTKVYGPNPIGSDEDTDTYNNPVLIGGTDINGILRRALMDTQGRFIISTISAILGAIYGAETIGNPPANPGVLTAVLNSAGNVVDVQLNANSEFKTHDADVLAAVDTVEAKLQTLISGGATPAVTSVAASAASVSVLAANANRIAALFTNDSTAIAYLKFGATASATSFTKQLQAGETFAFTNTYTGVVHAIWASATGNMRVTEVTP